MGHAMHRRREKNLPPTETDGGHDIHHGKQPSLVLKSTANLRMLKAYGLCVEYK
jgi:hypothetical protein